MSVLIRKNESQLIYVLIKWPYTIGICSDNVNLKCCALAIVFIVFGTVTHISIFNNNHNRIWTQNLTSESDVIWYFVWMCQTSIIEKNNDQEILIAPSNVRHIRRQIFDSRECWFFNPLVSVIRRYSVEYPTVCRPKSVAYLTR